jgi:DNA-directed RNA polymerase subunit omega
MARITVEDCLKHIPEPLSVGARRRRTARVSSAKAIHRRSIRATSRRSLRLREIAQGKVGIEMLRKVPT